MSAPRAPAPSLSSRQKRHLRGLGHDLEPVVQIGQKGVTESVLAQVAQALDDHELIKLKLGKNCPEDRDAVAARVEGLPSQVVQAIGRVLLVYREAEDPDDRRIALPPRGE